MIFKDYLNNEIAEAAYTHFNTGMPDWWWNKAIKRDGYSPEYYELSYGNNTLINKQKGLAKEDLIRGDFSYSFNRTAHPSDHVDCLCMECELMKLFSGKEFSKFVTERTGVEVNEVTECFASWYDSGDWLSSHHDTPNGKIGFIYQLSKDWKLEYGGILHYIADNGSIRAFVPEFNTLELFTINEKDSLHCVTEVMENCPSKRLAISGWLK